MRRRWILASAAALVLIAGTATVTRALSYTGHQQPDISVTGTLTIPDGFWCRADNPPAPGFPGWCTLVHVPMSLPPASMGLLIEQNPAGTETWFAMPLDQGLSISWQNHTLFVRAGACPDDESDEQCAADTSPSSEIDRYLAGTYRYWAVEYMGH